MTDDDKQPSLPSRNLPESTSRSQHEHDGPIPGSYAEEEIELGFALISRDKPNSTSNFDCIFATVSMSLVRRTSLDEKDTARIDGLFVLLFEDDKRKTKPRVELSLAESRRCFDAVCDAIERLSSLAPSRVKSKVSIPANKSLRINVCREGSRTNLYLQLGDLNYFVNQQDKFIGSITDAFNATNAPLRLNKNRILRLLSR